MSNPIRRFILSADKVICLIIDLLLWNKFTALCTLVLLYILLKKIKFKILIFFTCSILFLIFQILIHILEIFNLLESYYRFLEREADDYADPYVLSEQAEELHQMHKVPLYDITFQLIIMSVSLFFSELIIDFLFFFFIRLLIVKDFLNFSLAHVKNFFLHAQVCYTTSCFYGFY